MDGNYYNRISAVERAEMIKQSYINGERCKGFQQTVPVGQSRIDIDLSGQAKQFLGLALYNVNTTGLVVQLTINNDVVIQDANAAFFQVEGDTSPRKYYEFPRGLNGQDTITLNVNNTTGAGVALFLIVYYI